MLTRLSLGRERERADETSAVPTRLRLAFAPLLAVAALAAGCGPAPEVERSAASGLADEVLTRHEYIVRADAICERMNAESVAAAKSLKRRPSEAIERAIALQGRMIAELRALEPPPGDAAKVRPVLLHLDRLQAALRALRTTEGEEVLVPVAAIAVEIDAVARAAKRYGLFRRCGAYHENPGVQRIMRRKVSKPRPPRPATLPEIRRLASALVPPGSSVLRRQDCAGGDPASLSCVEIELDPGRKSLAERRAAFVRLATRAGWETLKLTGDRPRSGGSVVAFHRVRYDATVWLAGPDCTPHLQAGDGPGPTATMSRCVDTIMLIGRL